MSMPLCRDNIHNTIHIICSDSCGTLHIWYAYWFNLSPQELQLYVLINHSLDGYLLFYPFFLLLRCDTFRDKKITRDLI